MLRYIKNFWIRKPDCGVPWFLLYIIGFLCSIAAVVALLVVAIMFPYWWTILLAVVLIVTIVVVMVPFLSWTIDKSIEEGF